jgi:hypothetical protein
MKRLMDGCSVGAAALAIALCATASAQVQLGRRVLEPFDYRGVTLDDGPLKRQFDEVRDFYLRIPNDDLLKGFRKRAGRPAPGVDLGGWYTGDVFHIFGQILSGLARMSAATGDPACADKADALLKGWAECVAPDGFFFYSKSPNAPHYVYDKMVGGLVDMAAYRHSKVALACLSRITDWAIKNLGRERRYANLSNGTEWYTLSENLYRAYLLTGDRKYRDFARVWEYTDYWNVYARDGNIFDKKDAWYHAYSHVNTLGGAGAAYLATGEPHYLATLEHAYDFLQRTQCFATGGYGPNESLLPRDQLLDALSTTHATFETQCGSWAGFKMGKYLVSLTGDARYGDWIERLVIDGIGASIPVSAEGVAFYYSDYNTEEAVKVRTGDIWSCCTGTRPEAAADFHDLIYFKSPGRLLVNLYTPSTVQWGAVTLRQSTRFPETPASDVTVAVAKPARFTLGFRVPGWLSGPIRVTVNGIAVTSSASGKHWFEVKRTWRTRDRVHVDLPMGFWVHHVASGAGYPAALMYGPVAMAIRFSDRYPIAAVDLDRAGRGLVQVPGEPLNFHLAGEPGVLVRPLYEFKEGEPYVLYVDPAMLARVPRRTLRFTGAWHHESLEYTNEVGATVEADFEGVGLRWLGYKFDDGAITTVTVDGKHVADVDQYGPGRGLPFQWEIRGLAPGRHTIRLTVTEGKNPASKDRYVNVQAFEAIGK